MKFTLFSAFGKLDTKEWLLFGGLLAAAIILIAVIVKGRKKALPEATRSFDIKPLVYGALALSLAFVLSYLRLFRMPQGGSVTPGSMLPIMLYASWFGTKKGLLVGLGYGFLQMIQDAFFVHPAQILLDYILAFSVLGLAGLFRHKKALGFSAVLGLRSFFHFLSGVLFFGEYAAPGQTAVAYSLSYQLYTMVPELIITLVIYALLKKQLDELSSTIAGKVVAA